MTDSTTTTTVPSMPAVSAALYTPTSGVLGTTDQGETIYAQRSHSAQQFAHWRAGDRRIAGWVG